MSETKRILLVLTSHDDLGGVRPTGYYVGEAAHPWKVFTDAGYQVEVASIDGGVPPEDGRDESDPVQQEFVADPSIAAQLHATPKLADVDPGRYDAVLFVGGHGAMWDFPSSPAVDQVGRAIWDRGGVVSAVCHGPAALVNVTLDDGTPLIAGKHVTGFTNGEETAVGLTKAVPFLLADALAAKGATYEPAANWSDHVVVDGRLVTGQNPQSAASVGRAVVEALSVVTPQ